MEDVLDVYERPYDPLYPVVCMDEASRQLLEEIRTPFVDSHGVRCTDYEYIPNLTPRLAARAPLAEGSLKGTVGSFQI